MEWREQNRRPLRFGRIDAGQCDVQIFEPEAGNKPYTFVDRPKISLRIVSLLVWGVSGFLLYKAVVEPPAELWARWGILAIFALCCYSVIHEFMLRPARVTTIRAAQRQVVIQETAPWRKREIVASLPPGTR